MRRKGEEALAVHLPWVIQVDIEKQDGPSKKTTDIALFPFFDKGQCHSFSFSVLTEP